LRFKIDSPSCYFVEDGNIEFKKFQNFQVTSHERMEVLGTARKENLKTDWLK